MRRIAVLGLGHETNTFSPDTAGLALYEDGGIQRGQELYAVHAESESTYAGFLAPLERVDVEVVPLFAAWVNPRGVISAEAFTAMLDEMVALLHDHGPWDAVLLNLHGAAVAEGCVEADLHIARAVRAAVGEEPPIGLVVDMHANLSPALAEAVDVLLPYQTNPHVDPKRRGIACRAAILDILDGGARPGVHIESLPLIVNIVRQDTNEQPLHGLLQRAVDEGRMRGALDASILEGFPYADVPQMGMSVCVTHPDGTRAAQVVAERVAAIVWEHRAELDGGGVSIGDALDVAAARSIGDTVLLLDVGDNVGGGGPGDTTALLEAAQARRLAGILFTIQDPNAVEQLRDAAVGDVVHVEVGGWSGPEAGSSVPLRGTLVSRTRGVYEEPVVSHGGLRHFDTGSSIAIESEDGPTVIVTSKLVQPVSAQQLLSHGLRPAAFRAIVAKGVNGPRAGFGSVTRGHVVIDTPGITRLSVGEFVYQRRSRPMYPFEPLTVYPRPGESHA